MNNLDPEETGPVLDEDQARAGVRGFGVIYMLIGGTLAAVLAMVLIFAFSPR